MSDFETPNFTVNLSGQVALVTGASSGLGYRFSKVLAKCGAKVAIAARRVEKLEALEKEIRDDGGECTVVPLDVQDRDSLRNAVDVVENQFGVIDTLVNNAGMVDAQWAIKQDDALIEIAGRSRGTPRIANRVLKRVRDFAQVKKVKEIKLEDARSSLDSIGIDENGLENMDRKILKNLIVNYNGGPTGGKSLAISINEDIQTIEDVYEPYLIKEGFIERTSRGRIATDKAYSLFDLKK